MTNLEQIIIMLNNFSIGIVVPVFNLILLDKGSNLQTLPLLLTIYSLTVLSLELPSGICADLYGRKRVFLLSCGFKLIFYFLLLSATNIVWLIFTIIFDGIGRAFSSGSLDALLIDQALVRHGQSSLTKVTSRMAVLEGSSMAVGGLVGGFVSKVTGTYQANISLSAVLTILLLVLCSIFIREQLAPAPKQHTTLIKHIQHGKDLIFSTPQFALLLMGVFFVGFLLSTIETYWQPYFTQISSGQNSTWMLGLITFLGFLAVAVGNISVQKLLGKYDNWWSIWSIYHIMRITFAVCMIVFAFQKKTIGFVAWYTCIYFCLGTSNVTEATLLNQMTPNRMRASVLSLHSLLAQIGLMAASVFSSLMIMKLQFRGVWLVAGGILGGYAIMVALITSKKQSILITPQATSNKTGDTILPITSDFLKIEFLKRLRKVNIDAFIYVKNYANKFEIWVIFKKETPLEVDLQVSQIFCQLEKEYNNIDMSLFMASEKELDGHDITSF